MIALGVRVSEKFKSSPFPAGKTLVTGFGSRVSPVIALLFIIVSGAAARAQHLPAKSPRSPNQEETTQEFNQRLEESRKMLAGTLPDSRGDESRIGPGDLLEITVFEAPEMNRTLRVSANGEVSMQLLGPVKAAGLTSQELESLLVELLGRTYMKDPHVGVFVRELQSHPVSVVGAVKKPGVYQIPDSKTVIELLSMAEGLADDAGDTVLIMRGKSVGEPGTSQSTDKPQENGEIVKVNLKNLLESADSTLNVPVHSGDIVKVARAGIVYVVGEVKKPGGFVLKSNENISVLQALALAEGLTRISAKSQVRIIRTDQSTDKRIEIPVDLGKILASKSPDPILQPRDVVFVPDSSAKSAFYRGAEAVLSTATGVAIYRW
jgi:polysaccharide biosynthesis/export protein